MKKAIRTTFTGILIGLTVASSAFAKPEVIKAGNLFLKDSGGIFPTRLPKSAPAPISARVTGQIGTNDGSHPPAITSVIADFDKSIHVNARGLPVCAPAELAARSTTSAEKACPNAIVGSGHAEVEVAFPESTPFTATGPLVLFNGGVRGSTTLLLIHTYIAVPAPTAVVASVKITSIHRGHFGLHAVAQIPAIAGGSGSVTDFQLRLGRRFTAYGSRDSYLTASCPTGHYFTEGEVLFVGGSSLKISHVFPCTPVG